MPSVFFLKVKAEKCRLCIICTQLWRTLYIICTLFVWHFRCFHLYLRCLFSSQLFRMNGDKSLPKFLKLYVRLKRLASLERTLTYLCFLHFEKSTAILFVHRLYTTLAYIVHHLYAICLTFYAVLALLISHSNNHHICDL